MLVYLISIHCRGMKALPGGHMQRPPLSRISLGRRRVRLIAPRQQGEYIIMPAVWAAQYVASILHHVRITEDEICYL